MRHTDTSDVPGLLSDCTQQPRPKTRPAAALPCVCRGTPPSPACLQYGGFQQYSEWANGVNASTVSQFYQDASLQVRSPPRRAVQGSDPCRLACPARVQMAL